MVDRQTAPSITGTSQRAAIACQNCRQRKVKCDAQSAPSDEGCGPCRRAGQECLLDPLSDGRRSVNRKFVDKLQRRIEMLEAMNQRPADQLASRVDEDSANNHEYENLLQSGLSSRSPAIISRSTATTDVGPSRHSSSTDSSLSSVPCRSYQILPAPISNSGSSPEEIRGRSPSFYGATSHPHVVSSSEEPRLTPSDEVDAVGIDLDPTSSHLRDHLVQSFFEYQTLWVDVVNKESFLTHQAKGVQSRWYSKFLENAILACGTRLSTSKSARALGPKYCEWAKGEALSAMSEPTPANMQGFLLLSEYEVTQGNDRPGWMFCGVACRMLSDLGLHELASNTGARKETEEPSKEGDLAYALLSACVVYEGVWTLYLGRPSSFPRSIMSIAALRCKERRKSDSQWLNAWVGLCIPMADITSVLNDRSISDSDRSTALRKLFKQIEEWYESLPTELIYNENRLTSMDLAGYGLHSQYCKIQILLRRALGNPRSTKKRRYSQIANDAGVRASCSDSDVMIYHYALRIARLVVTYREAFGMEKIPSIMLDNAVVAATAMIEHLNEADRLRDAQQETIWLRQLVKSMESVQPHYPIIGRMLDSLKQVRGSGPLFGILPHSSHETLGSHELPDLGQPLNLESRQTNIQNNSIGAGNGTNTIWDCFETGFTSGMFSTGEFDDFVLDLPSESLISGLA